MTNDNAQPDALTALLTQVEAIRERRAAISAAPWRDDITDDGFLLVRDSDDISVCGFADMEDVTEDDSHNSTFIANAPTDIDTLLSLVAALNARIDEIDAAMTEPYRTAEADDVPPGCEWLHFPCCQGNDETCPGCENGYGRDVLRKVSDEPPSFYKATPFPVPPSVAAARRLRFGNVVASAVPADVCPVCYGSGQRTVTCDECGGSGRPGGDGV